MKIRKIVAKHFLFFFLDVIALPFAVATLFSWRGLALIEALLGTPDFHNFFAVVSLQEFAKYMVDIPTLIGFLILLPLR